MQHDEEREYRLTAVALLAPRDANGRIGTDRTVEGTLIGSYAAQQLMRESVQIGEGMGGFTLMVPKALLEKNGLDTTWAKAQAKAPTMFENMERGGKAYYHVRDQRMVDALSDLLTLQAGKSFGDVAASKGQGGLER